MAAPVYAAESTSFAYRFKALAEQWKADTAFESSSTVIRAHPAYQEIIAMGSAVVPLILHDLESDSAHWFDALQAITGVDPVARADWGNIPAMRTAWLSWGRKHGLV